MIIFHEGLPRSGKSYESTVEWILPALKKGRKVFARINGLNHEKFAELADLTLDECKALLIPISEEQVPTIYQHVENDALVIIDELQNFFPSGRMKLSDEMTKFVTEHGHRGLDIVCMGQSLADCHNIWRRRVQRKIQFLKLDALGTDKKYKWTAYQGMMDAKGEITFTKMNAGVKSYDPQYFGTYASHQADTENKGNLKDNRLNVWNSPIFKFYIPAAIFAACYGVYHLYSFFQPATPPQKVEQVQQAPLQQQTQQAAIQQTPPNQPPPKPKDWDFVMELNEKYKVELTYLSEFNGFIYDALVVWTDDNNRVKDQLYYADLKELGYKVAAKSYGLLVTKGDHKFYYRWKPKFEVFGTVPEQAREQMH
jgi:zona occludens toxin